MIFEGRKCVGITYRQDGSEKEVRAAKEVVLCGGAYNSPHLLQISGIGPGNHLRDIGVDVLRDLSGVGGNLADHWGARIKHNVRAGEITMNQLSRPRQLIHGYLAGTHVVLYTGAPVVCQIAANP